MSNNPDKDTTVGSIYDLTTNIFVGLQDIMIQLYSGKSFTNDDLFTKLSDIAGGILLTQERLAYELMVDKKMQDIMLQQIDTKRTGLNSATDEVKGRIAAAFETQTSSNSLGSMFK